MRDGGGDRSTRSGTTGWTTGEIEEWKPEEERAGYHDLFAEAGAFVFTFGLAEVWQDRETGGVFWRGVPDSIFDSDRHVFRLTTVEENADEHPPDRRARPADQPGRARSC